MNENNRNNNLKKPLYNQNKMFESHRKLEEILKRCSNVSMSDDRRLRMRQQILSGITMKREEEASFAVLIGKLKQLAEQISPKEYFRVLLKEKLMVLSQYQHQTSFWNIFQNRGARRAFSSVLAFVFVFTVLFNFTFRIDRVEASVLTVLESMSGEVLVVRDGKEISAAAGFVLKADDIIATGSDSKAEIRFLDQSVSRLDENTEIKISRLFVNPLNKTETIVEVIVHHGRIWARVINLINNLSRFQVKANNTVAVAKKKAAFDVSVSSKGKAKVAAIQNKIDLVVATDRKVMETTLVNGFSAETNATITPVKIKGTTDNWVSDNLAEDKVYIESIKQGVKDQIRDQVQLLPGNPFYPVKELSKATKIVLTFDDLERQKMILMKAAENMDEAGLLVEKGDKEKAKTLLLQFQSDINGVLDYVKQAETTDPAEAVELQTRVNELLGIYEKRMAVILPDDALYQVKMAVGETKIIATTNPVQKTEEKLSQASDKLLEANDLVEKGDTASATVQVKAYSSGLSDVISDVKNLTVDDQGRAVSALLDTKAEALKVLSAISLGTSSVPVVHNEGVNIPTVSLENATTTPLIFNGTSSTDLLKNKEDDFVEPVLQSDASKEAEKQAAEVVVQNGKDLQQSVSDAKTQTLEQVGEAVLQVQKEQNSVEVLQKLQDLRNIDVNGKQLLDVKVMSGKVQVKSDDTVVSVGTATQVIPVPSVKPLLPTKDLETPESPLARP